jgi:hypothetical protein
MVSAGVLTIVALFLAITFEMHFRELRKLQPMVVNAQNNQNFVNSLATEALEYSKQHPALDPILQTVGVKPGGKGAPTSIPKPAGK